MYEDVATEATDTTFMAVFVLAILGFAMVGVYYVGRLAWKTIRRLIPKK
jgi:hypothetical protein